MSAPGVIVVGASSGIGEGLARGLAERGGRVVLAARREPELERIRREIQENCGEDRARVLVHDAAELDGIPAAFARALELCGGRLDTFVYAAGLLPPELNESWDAASEARVMTVNASAAVAWLSLAAAHMAERGSGTLVGIGSIAGDRGRRAQPAYGASKAALHHYLEGLRVRLHERGVRVVSIRPGPIATAMTEGLAGIPEPAPLGPSVATMLGAIEGGRAVVYVPAKWGLVSLILRLIPRAVFKRLRI